jgi:hypothetical protein
MKDSIETVIIFALYVLLIGMVIFGIYKVYENIRIHI